jgi:hypothetical protein
MSDQDLSHVYANSDMDEAQENHSALPHELKMHMAMGFAHKAGLLQKHPGKYSGPPVVNPLKQSKDPTEWVPPQSPADVQGQQQMQESDALNNLAESGTPNTTPARPSKSPDWSKLV